MHEHIESYEYLTRLDFPNKKFKCVANAFWNRVIKSDGCWGWTGQKHPHGYGEIERRYEGKRYVILAHRISWILHKGKIPHGLRVLHACDNPPCTNPDHLFLGTQLENIQDAVMKGRNARGERLPGAKLTNITVRKIRELHDSGGITHQALADQFGVTRSLITCVVNRQIWKHVMSSRLKEQRTLVARIRQAVATAGGSSSTPTTAGR